ncbi:radical SAM protein [Streptomyces sp. NPDC007264]|uniref:radical SAM protein n=1 Tax=Streptomyces sp. NPDC007264 TaxID=3364777 RepID=UPI0036DAE663
MGERHYQARLWAASNLSTRMAPRRIRPSDVSIKLTENCQARCVTCDYWKHRWTDHIGTDQAVDLLSRLSDIGVTTIRFTGGEPLLRRDLFQVLERANTSGFTTVALQTNGLLLRRFAPQVNDSPFTHVVVSLDAVGERNDQIRGIKGYFDRALEGLEKVEGKTRIVAMTLNQLGAGDLSSLLDHVDKLGGYLACNLPDNRLYFLQDADLSGLWPDEQASEHLISTLASRLGDQFTPYELDYIRGYLRQGDPTTRSANPPCVLGYTTVYISSDGTVRSGCYVLPPIGNILEQDIEAILDSQEYRDRATSMLRLECPGCACNVFKSLRTKNAVQDRLRSVRHRMAAMAEG